MLTSVDVKFISIAHLKCLFLSANILQIAYVLRRFVFLLLLPYFQKIYRRETSKMFRHFVLTTKATQLRPQVFSVNGSIICNFGCTFDVIRPIWHNSSKFGEQQLVMMNYACDLTNQKRRNIMND